MAMQFYRADKAQAPDMVNAVVQQGQFDQQKRNAEQLRKQGAVSGAGSTIMGAHEMGVFDAAISAGAGTAGSAAVPAVPASMGVAPVAAVPAVAPVAGGTRQRRIMLFVVSSHYDPHSAFASRLPTIGQRRAGHSTHRTQQRR